MDSGSTSKSEEKPKLKKSASNSNVRTFGTIGSTEPGKIGSLKGSKLTFKPKIPARRKQIKVEDEDKPKKSTKERKGKKGNKDKDRKSRGRPTYEPSALSGPFAQGAARPGVKKEYGSSRSSFSSVSLSGSTGGIRVEEESSSETKPKIDNIKFRDINDDNEDEYYEEDENAVRPISLIDLTHELNEKMEKIQLEEKNFTFKKIKFEDELKNVKQEAGLRDVKRENLDEMETEDSSITRTEDNSETYNYPASDLLRNDINPENNILFFQFPSVLPEIINNAMETDSNKVKIETSDGKIAKVDLDTNSNAPEGKMGKLIIYKSGKMKIKIGDILFDINPGTDCNFYQNAFSFNTEKKEGYILGDIRKRYICTPDIESLLK